MCGIKNRFKLFILFFHCQVIAGTTLTIWTSSLKGYVTGYHYHSYSTHIADMVVKLLALVCYHFPSWKWPSHPSMHALSPYNCHILPLKKHHWWGLLIILASHGRPSHASITDTVALYRILQTSTIELRVENVPYMERVLYALHRRFLMML